MRTEPLLQTRTIYLLVRNSILLNRASILIVSAAAAGILLCLSLVDALVSMRPDLHQPLYLTVLFSGGLLLTSRNFKELHDPVQGPLWLLLPASLLEKTLARILLSTVVFVAGSMLLYLVFSLISEGLNQLLISRRHVLFRPFDPLVLKSALSYTAVQAPFLLGALVFRKHALSKTILSLLGLALVFGLGLLAAVRIVFWDQFPGSNLQVLHLWVDSDPRWSQLAIVGQVAAWTGKTVFWIVIPILSWTICYLRLKETER